MNKIYNCATRPFSLRWKGSAVHLQRDRKTKLDR